MSWSTHRAAEAALVDSLPTRTRLAHVRSQQDGHGIDGEYKPLEKFNIFRRRLHAPTLLA